MSSNAPERHPKKLMVTDGPTDRLTNRVHATNKWLRLTITMNMKGAPRAEVHVLHC